MGVKASDASFMDTPSLSYYNLFRRVCPMKTYKNGNVIVMIFVKWWSIYIILGNLLES